MANIHTVFEAVVDNGLSGKRVQLEVVDKNEYETVRTRLVKLWVAHRDIIVGVTGEDGDPLAACSLCGDYSSTTNTATFYLGKPRRKLAKSYSFAIVDATPLLPAHAVNDEPPPPVFPDSLPIAKLAD